MFIEHLIKTKQLVAIYPIRSCGLILQQSIVGLSCLRARIVIAFEKNVIIFIAIHGRKSQPIGKLDIEVKVSHKLIGSFLLIIPLQVIQVICSIAIHPSRSACIAGSESPFSSYGESQGKLTYMIAPRSCCWSITSLRVAHTLGLIVNQSVAW